ncbi:MAG: pirin family protein [Chitinophagaceae bacterium]|nr:pirin family protein [Chitinophagaceae bacterium]
MINQRKIVRRYTPEAQPGFLGAGHLARPVVAGGFENTDPFILLMDDELDKKDNSPVGGAHPHAGFETVTLLLDGEIGDAAHKMKRGDFQLMTAGSGIVHTETIDKIAKMRLLQLWLNLPKNDRNVLPRVQDLSNEHVPSFSQNGLSIKLYSGSFGGLSSPISNYSAMIVADINIHSNTGTTQELPANFNSFIYVLEGTVTVGEDGQTLQKGEVGWLDRSGEVAQSKLTLSAGIRGSRFVLYAGLPTGDSIVSHGPFIADSSEHIMQLYKEYRQGRMIHINDVPQEQRIVL